MGYDWLLIAALNHDAHHRALTYRCPFVEAIREVQQDPFGSGDAPKLIRTALEILALPLPRRARSRGCVRAYNAQDDGWGWDHRDEVSGEFEAR